ncbi:FMN-binding protein [Secundilactobacillus paracollinoides]|uniref:FMN-binding protein n=1 Tax=Secundilactobacillus paracollinoides TaxID=240427 RepID=UPI0006CF9167|nr:FMN-binding protein [Secundilactobacillus paracollinoides]KRL80135.1 hypothetical protein FC17_GL000015 [Secundilactobacillus paracollinoides DSM 15502 = JCM 11969]
MSRLKDGTYQGSGTGNRGEISVSVTVKNDKITNVSIVDQNETDGISTAALKKAPELIMDYQSYSIDAVTGATVSFQAVQKAVQEALAKAGDNSIFDKPVDLRHTVEDKDDNDYRYLDPETIKFEDSSDVLIIGAGASGLSAAIAAREAGASALVLGNIPPAICCPT